MKFSISNFIITLGIHFINGVVVFFFFLSNSEHTTFVAVPEAKTRYKIIFAALEASKSNPMIAKIYIDGKNDIHYRLCESLTYEVSGFYNEGYTKMHDLMFDNTEWVEKDLYEVDSNKVNSNFMEFGGLGAISVYFYKGIYRSNFMRFMQYNSNVDIEQTKISEGKKCVDIVYTTKFDKGKEASSPDFGQKLVIIGDSEPVAALHINYRPLDWIMMNVDTGSPSGSLEYKPIKKESLDEISVKLENDDDKISIKLEDDECKGNFTQDPIIISDDNSDDVIINRKRNRIRSRRPNRKRKFR